MPDHELLTDDYVAKLLAQEAQDCSLKYSAMGLDAYKSAKRPANQPKPNTRFLNNIIRDTNSHNRALLAKEKDESKARLRDLEHAEQEKQHAEERKSQKSRPGPRDTRKRMLGDIAAIIGGPSKRRRTERNDRPASNASEWAQFADSNDSDRRRKTAGQGQKRETESSNMGKELFSESPGNRHRSRHRDRDNPSGRSNSPVGHRSRRQRERSPRRKGDLFDDRGHSDRGKRLETAPSDSKEDSSDSDPLEDIIGPAPPDKPTVRRRGRGANSATSGIDSRFAPDYDPTTDVTPEPEDIVGDWDDAVETFRDRQKLKQQGAARLRSAGFTEDQVRKWEKGDQKDESDVQWNKRGGVREWDRGKVVDQDRSVAVKAEWGRLKDT
ncbi:Uu.00g108700.m01.CDS01 [Anthostomella pinea]|uniref:Uu.00g108700.m01.CDS01 n=1 Tax=Anthostomella pinea TaxID=933095 RepID=A0AAI8YDP3_9PEZI|nr:Uu.00g108700.m01.CDS01 [Anthostomella pinea]